MGFTAVTLDRLQRVRNRQRCLASAGSISGTRAPARRHEPPPERAPRSRSSRPMARATRSARPSPVKTASTRSPWCRSAATCSLRPHQGNLGRSHVSIGQSGEDLDVPITFLGRGTVMGVGARRGGQRRGERDAAVSPSSSIFGSAPKCRKQRTGRHVPLRGRVRRRLLRARERPGHEPGGHGLRQITQDQEVADVEGASHASGARSKRGGIRPTASRRWRGERVGDGFYGHHRCGKALHADAAAAWRLRPAGFEPGTRGMARTVGRALDARTDGRPSPSAVDQGTLS